MNNKLNILNYSLSDLEQYFVSHDEKKYRATQIFEWLFRYKVSSFCEMTNLSKKMIDYLNDTFYIPSLTIKDMQESSDGTRKYLFSLSDGNTIETVLMRHNYGNSVCVTSEVGCNMGCKFCASGELSCIRRLELYEMVLQVLTIDKDLYKNGERVSNVVVMGIGEPFDNYDNLLKFLRVINYPKGLEIGARHITVSTCGIVPKIKEFADFDLQINLALSLHAPNDTLRSSLMKINKAYPLSEVLDALNYYFVKTNRRITFEYILLDGINDSKENALELVKLIKGMNAYVNLIPYNEVSTKEFKKTPHDKAEEFFTILRKNNINATLRMEHGADIDAACGQLRAKRLMNEGH